MELRLDEIDKKIICELDLNCRIPLSQLAKKLKTSRNVITYRIKNLEENGMISKYICAINLGVLGYKTYKIYFKIQNQSQDFEKKFIKSIADDKKSISFLKNEGAFDYSVSVAVKSIKELDEFLTELNTKFKSMIKDYFVSIVVYSKVFRFHKLLLNEKELTPKIEKYSGEEKRIEIDDKDRKVINELSQNSNLSLVALAKRTGLSIDVIKYRLKYLNENKIIYYRAMLNFDKLGYYHYVMLLKLRMTTREDEERLVEWCAEKNNVLYCMKRIGYFDFEVHTAIKDIGELNSFISGFKTEFGTIINSYETIINSEVLKLNYNVF